MSSSSASGDVFRPLGDLIAEDRASRRGRGRGRGAGPARRGRPLGQSARANGAARSSSYQQGPAQSGRRSSTGTSNGANSSSSSNASNAGRVVGDTIFVSNLSKDITAEDVTDIFSRVGSVKNASVNYNQNGESQGTAEVTFQRKDDAETAVKEYDQAEVEGRVMYVKLVAQFVKAPTVVRRPQTIPQRPAGRAPPRVDRRQQTVSRGGGATRGTRGGRGRGRGRGGKSGDKPTKESLDADLENYRSGAAAGQPAAPSDA